jgi:hypothetical protein
MLTNSDDLCSLENAEGEILASLIVRPELLPKLEIVEPEWFSRGEDRILWKAFRDAAHKNDGVAEPATANRFLVARYPEQAKQLLNRMVGHVNRNYGAGELADNLFEYHFKLLQNNGIRRTHWIWAKSIAIHCEQRQPLDELRSIVDDRPGFGSAVGQ